MPSEVQTRPPRNEHELELRLVRLMGNDNRRMLVMRNMMASAIAGQFLPKGAVFRGGGSLRFRFGRAFTRNTMDFDMAFGGELDDFLNGLRESLAAGWSGFTGEISILPQASPKGVPAEYVMQPVDIKLRYRNNPWCRVNLEISRNEVGDTDECDLVEIPEEVAATFRDLGFPVPAPIALMTLEHQVAQKLHGASDTAVGNGRAHDLIDLQLILRGSEIDLAKTRRICERLFAWRRRQPWPTPIVARRDWDGIYDRHRRDLDVLPSVAEAVAWANELICKITQA